MPKTTQRMLAPARQRKLLEILRVRGSVRVEELAEALGTSPSTVRRDLTEMDEHGMLDRVHGGATSVSVDEPIPIVRASERLEQKAAIGQAAAELVDDGSTILVTGGTTTETMVPFLAERSGVTVVTNNLAIAMLAGRASGLEVVVLGGLLRPSEQSLLGHLTQTALSEFVIDTAFSGAYGIDVDSGVAGANVQEAQTDRVLLGSARRLVLLADSSKFGRRGPVRLARISSIDVLITDRGAPADDVRQIADAGVEVQTV